MEQPRQTRMEYEENLILLSFYLITEPLGAAQERTRFVATENPEITGVSVIAASCASRLLALHQATRVLDSVTDL